MNTIVESHANGIKVVPNDIINEICDVFSTVEFSLKKYVINDLRAAIPIKLKQLGWSDNVVLDRNSKINITSIRDNIGLCMQTGNVSRIYADLLKLQTLFLRGTIKAGIVIIPTLRAAKSFGGNVASLERLLRELPIFKQVITMPIVIIGFYE
ncbi:BglII/BstYI family type II restriction endonuclease [Alloiococcus sp. CFN-8]|uniref:BglII/BstYI family type II restriction endonuclease n=1 Tax=Alloiococcus sp. CFN-8 TaxID=3416081 RepID=UPI003CEC1276